LSEEQLFAKVSAIEKALAGRCKGSVGSHVARGPYGV